MDISVEEAEVLVGDRMEWRTLCVFCSTEHTIDENVTTRMHFVLLLYRYKSIDHVADQIDHLKRRLTDVPSSRSD